MKNNSTKRSKIKTQFLFFFSFILIACQHSPEIIKHKLKGHWHLIDNPYYNFTLDIDDSTVAFDKYSMISDVWRRVFPLIDSADGQPTLPIPCGCGSSIFPAVKDFFFFGDTLFYDKKTADECYAFTPLKFIKSDIPNCYRDHIFGRTLRIFKLDSLPAGTGPYINFDSLTRNCNVANLVIGFPKKEEFDTTKLRLYTEDVFINFSEIKNLIEYKNNESEDPSKQVVFCLVVDPSVPQSLKNKVIREIQVNGISSIYLLTSSPTGEIGYQLVL